MIPTLTRKQQLVVDLRDYGAVGDGVADDTLAAQAAVTAAGVSSRAIWWGPGTYLITDTLTVPLGGYSWVGARPERGFAAHATTIKFRPLDTTKHLVKTSSATFGAFIGPFTHENLAFDIGDANGFELGLDDGVQIVDGSGQAYVSGVRFENVTIIATYADRVSTAGVLTRSGRRMIALTRCFEAVLQDVSLQGCDTQVKTWGCDKPTFRNIRSLYSHLPFDLNGKPGQSVQHVFDNIQVEGWTFSPMRNLDTALACSDSRFEQTDGAPTGSGRWAIPGTFTFTAPGTLVRNSGSLAGILFPYLSLVEITDGTFTHLAMVTAVSGTTVTIDSTTLAAQVSTSAGAVTATRVHGYGPLHWSDLQATFMNISTGASAGCPAFVYVVDRGSMFVVNAEHEGGSGIPVVSAVVGNRLSGAAFVHSQMSFVNCSPFVNADPDDPFVTTFPQRPRAGTYVEGRSRFGPPMGELLTSRRWSWTPKDTGTASNNSHTVPIVPVAGDASTSQRVYAWLVRSTGPVLLLNDRTLPGVSGTVRVRIRARSLGATASVQPTYVGNGGAGPSPIALTSAWSTTTYVIATPSQWIGSIASDTGIQFSIPATSADDFYLAAVSVEELTPEAANADTSGLAVAALETEVNQLKAALRAAGIIAA